MSYTEVKAIEDTIKRDIRDAIVFLEKEAGTSAIEDFTFNLVQEINKLRKKKFLSEFK